MHMLQKGLDNGEVLSSIGSRMIYTIINALHQDTLQAAAANEMGQTITLHLPNNDQGEEMDVVNDMNEKQVIMIQENGGAPQEGTVASTADGQIVHTLSQLLRKLCKPYRHLVVVVSK
jgi:hypothetical protein